MTPGAKTTVGERVDPADLPLFLPTKPVLSTPDVDEPVLTKRTAAPAPAPPPAAGGMDWGLVQTMRAQVADQLAKEGRTGFGDEERELGRSIITGLVGAETRARQQMGVPWSVEAETAHAKAVFDAVFGMGRFQPLLDDSSVENIVVVGHDSVVLEHKGGYRSYYGNLMPFEVKIGDKVKHGAEFAKIASQAPSSLHEENSASLHFELKKGEMALNPEIAIPRMTTASR